MDFQVGKHYFDLLFSHIDGYELSMRGRQRQPYYDRAFTYGEVTPFGLYNILNDISIKPTDVFYDLGSGTGKAVIIAALYFHFAKAIGIEYLHELYTSAEQTKKRFIHEVQPHLQHSTHIDFRQEDLHHADFTEADVVFIHATCFHDSLIRAIEKGLENLKSGSRVIIVSRPLSSPSLKLFKAKDYQFTWGMASVFIYEKQ